MPLRVAHQAVNVNLEERDVAIPSMIILAAQKKIMSKPVTRSVVG